METLRRTVKETRFVALLAVIIALIGSGTGFYIANRDADHARVLAADAKKLAKQAAAVSATKRAILHAADVRSCKRDHRFALTFTQYLRESTARSEKLLATPGALAGLSPTIVANARESVAKTRALREKIEMADCDPSDPLDVPPLNPKKEGP